VVSYLAPAVALIVLDNCEHVIGEAALVAEELTRRCSGVSVIATSREPLWAAGETEWRVPSMAMPPMGDGAVRLFVDRAAKVRIEVVTGTGQVQDCTGERNGALCAADSADPGPGYVPDMLARNVRLFELARDAHGGTLYPIGAVPMSHDDWRVHYGQRWHAFAAAMNRFDPHHVLAQGVSIF
jgi:hypothetical protein